MFIHKKTVIFIPYFDSPFCLINYWQNGGFFLKSEIPEKIRSALTVKKTSMKNVARGIENMRPSVHTTLNESTRLDENNVDMDQEQVELARTAYEYQFMISSVSSDLSRLRSAAKNF